MSGYRPGHDPYIDYAPHAEGHSDEQRSYGSHHPELQHAGASNLNTLQNLAAHQQQQQQQQRHQQQQVLLDPHGMAHHQSPQYGGGQRLMGYGAPPPPMQAHGPPMQQQPQLSPMQQQQVGSKRPRTHEELEMEMGGMPEGSLQGMPSQQLGQSMGGYGGPTQAYHTHALPNQGPRSKIPRLGDDPDSSMMSQSAPSVVGAAGMPPPAPRPRGPKLKFTPEDDQLLVDLKENKSLTWKQIAEFFPGRSSGTLQVRYCTKLKAKTTQWTDETVQKLRTALHDYEQEKWRIIAQKVGTGFTSAACKEKAEEL
ncbi:hypothetical protein BP6252_00767 [Coleophoma cylindrospora]|uniref:Myb-like domain-containing protein n=1 Tax=Coleophoma cylindrospora TaxID=1849047 RepID=A0A3D8SR00_9HELO|nr:hypothetical protein BP6252_00767 [Coleophoma cylindrospora]